MRLILSAAILAFLSVTSVPAQSASQCKTLAAELCRTSSTCTFVKGYKTKTGRTVKGYCRKAAKRTDKQKVKAPSVKSARPAPTSATVSRKIAKPKKVRRQRLRKTVKRRRRRDR